MNITLQSNSIFPITAVALKKWIAWHKWTSLVCTLFMLLVCLTGLPLIFHHEIGHFLGTEIQAPTLSKPSENIRRINVDSILQTARQQHPSKQVMYLAQERDDDKIWFVTLGDKPDSQDDLKQVAIDARTGKVLGQPPLDSGFMYVMLKLHVDLFAGLPGSLFLGAMGLLLLISTLTGLVLYAPFTKRLRFGEIRRHRSSQTKWLDLHNVLGIVTVAWVLVVSATGVLNTWAELLLKAWQQGQMAEMTAPYKGLAIPKSVGSLETALKSARAQEKTMQVGFVAFPGTAFSSPHHYAVFMRGDDPLTSRLFKPVLVDAVTSKVTASRTLPWYLTVLLVSQPLHFGDYGGFPLKIIWALFDILAIFILLSGLVLWVKHRKKGFEVERNY
jgi:uncharacterized iron-regulated membrane protein